ncbi:hypothetical protein F442_19528 [Phytophthora nicotianae P10297]|uniref:Uncharacterized protein n=1 Tax=Phytophthora nicotianae P10297 TaxID=1317064 RepID=W2YBP6_PHYNI|nr:hypothetical protein F442_19528 [Phytophthora nicotianae P10297]
MASSNVDQALPNAFFAFFEWCQEQRWWDRLDEAARYLRNWQARITEARLIGAPAQNDDTCEHEWVLPFGMNRRGLPTFQMRTILDDDEIKKYRQRKRRNVAHAYIGTDVKEE